MEQLALDYVSDDKKVVPQGYKLTEVGVIPEDWEIFLLENLAFFGGGTTPARNLYDRFYLLGTHPWLKTLDLNNNYIWQSEENVTDAALVETSLKKYKIGTVLVAMYGGFNQIGRTGLIKIEAAINQALLAITPKPDKMLSEYLLFNLNYNIEYWKSVASSSRKDPNITSQDVKKYKLLLPPLPEQTAIADALSDVDALISQLEKLIAKKQAIKTATMQQLLTGKTRLLSFALREDGSPKGYKMTELGEVPEDWEVKSIGEISAVFSGGTPNRKNPDYWGGDIPWVTTTLINGGVIEFANEFITVKGLEESSAKWCKQGVILMAMYGQGKTRGKVAKLGFNATINQACAAIDVKNTYNSDFVLHFFNNKYDEIRDLSNSGGQENLSSKIIKDLIIYLPQFPEQTAIASILSDMDNDIQQLNQRLNKTRHIKQGMMQELLTGKTRLVNLC